VALSKGELVSVVTNKASKGGKGSLVALITGTRSQQIAQVVQKMSVAQRSQVNEVSLDMAPNMALAIKQAFPNASHVVDHFHVAQLVNQMVQYLRIKQRWVELDREATAIITAKKQGLKYTPETLLNEQTPKQFLARSRFLLYKNKHQWSVTQQFNGAILFQRYPHLEQTYEYGQAFLRLFRLTDKAQATKAFEQWIRHTYQQQYEVFYRGARWLQAHKEGILNFFNNRTTNAAAESFNAKIKGLEL